MIMQSAWIRAADHHAAIPSTAAGYDLTKGVDTSHSDDGEGVR